jgi:hypothetical protein
MFKVAKGGQMKIRNNKIKHELDGKAPGKYIASPSQVAHSPASHIQSMGAYRSPGFQLENPPQPPIPAPPKLWAFFSVIFFCIYLVMVVTLFTFFCLTSSNACLWR